MSKILDIVNSPWALQPEKLAEVVAIYCAHVRGEKIDIKAIEAQLGKPLANDQPPYDIHDGVAVIPIHGVIAKRMNMMTRISGGVSTELVGSELRAALADSRVHSVILNIDSPGGTVDGTQTLADQVHAARGGGKPIVAWADGAMTSGAYWIGSAAGKVYLSGDTVITGSIGVATQHVDVSRAEERVGIKTSEIYAGKYKRIASEYAPLSDEGRAHLQGLVDQIYSVFVDQIARNRGTDAETVLKDMAEGRLFVGRAAIDAGLVDGVSTLDALIAGLKAGALPAMRARAGGSAPAAQANPASGGGPVVASGAQSTDQLNPKGRPMSITRDFLNANHADLVEAIRLEGYQRGETDGRIAGADAERARIQSVEAQSLPGHDRLIATLKFDGKTTGAEAAVQILAAEKALGAGRAAALAADGGAIVVPALASALAQGVAAVDDDQLPVEERCKAKWDKDPAIRAEFGDYATYLAFEKAHASGRVKVLGRKAA